MRRWSETDRHQDPLDRLREKTRDCKDALEVIKKSTNIEATDRILKSIQDRIVSMIGGTSQNTDDAMVNYIDAALTSLGNARKALDSASKACKTALRER